MVDILVIDDDHNILYLISIFLTNHGYTVKTVDNGLEGIRLFKENGRFKLVITDIRMPGADGNQVAKYLKDNEEMRNTPIIGISAFPDEAEEGLFDSILEKPFSLHDLVSLVDSLS